MMKAAAKSLAIGCAMLLATLGPVGPAQNQDGDRQGTPLAQPDAYQTFQGKTRTIHAPGVLANDTGSSLQAVQNESPSYGTLRLGNDGSFTYTPAADFTGSDKFRYHATSGGSQSDYATVTITTMPLPSGEGGSLGGGLNPGATPELDSLILFAGGISGLAGYVLMRHRARRR
jgi:hypothetical protein